MNGNSSSNNNVLNTIASEVNTANQNGNKILQGLIDDFPNIAGDISGATEVISLAGNIVSALSPQVNQTDQLLTSILSAVQNGIQQLAGLISDTFADLMHQNVDTQVGSALTGFGLLKKAAGEGPTSSDAANSINDALTAVNTLNQDSFWQVPVSAYPLYWTDPEQLYPQGWASGTLNATYQIVPTPSSGNNVFNYVYILPAYMHVLSLFVTVATVLDPKFLADFGGPNGQLTSAVAFLKAKHDQILNGIVTLSPAIDFFNALTSVNPNNPLSPNLPWVGQDIATMINDAAAGGFSAFQGAKASASGVNIEFGAVEPYSGASSVGMYPQLTVGTPAPAGSMPTNIDPKSTDPGPYLKFQIRLKKRQKDVYVAAGLPAVVQQINNIYQLLGMPQMQIARPTFADWSLKRDILSEAPVQPVNGKISLMAIAKFIKYTPPADTPAQSLFTSLGSLIYVDS